MAHVQYQSLHLLSNGISEYHIGFGWFCTLKYARVYGDLGQDLPSKVRGREWEGDETLKGLKGMPCPLQRHAIGTGPACQGRAHTPIPPLCRPG